MQRVTTSRMGVRRLFEDLLGMRIRDAGLLWEAFEHPNTMLVPSGENAAAREINRLVAVRQRRQRATRARVLELVGDAVLRVVLLESFLTRREIDFERVHRTAQSWGENELLAQAAGILGIDEIHPILRNRFRTVSPTAKRRANLFEMLLGVAYLDRGYAKARASVFRLFEKAGMPGLGWISASERSRRIHAPEWALLSLGRAALMLTVTQFLRTEFRSEAVASIAEKRSLLITDSALRSLVQEPWFKSEQPRLRTAEAVLLHLGRLFWRLDYDAVLSWAERYYEPRLEDRVHRRFRNSAVHRLEHHLRRADFPSHRVVYSARETGRNSVVCHVYVGSMVVGWAFGSSKRDAGQRARKRAKRAVATLLHKRAQNGST